MSTNPSADVRPRDYYLSLRRVYQPDSAKLIIIAESPPISGLYFYDPTGAVSEPLFAAMMKRIGIAPASKDAGLCALQQKGWVLVDATYQPVNQLIAPARNKIIQADYPLLRQDLERIDSDKTTPTILIKANVCRLLEPRLAADGFDVVNRGRPVYFPSTGQQSQFHRQWDELIRTR